MIPKKIHYCWFGRGEKPKLAQKCITSWEKYCPDYEIIEWNEDNFDIGKYPYAQYCMEQKKWAFLSDFARLAIVAEEGGIYLDTDVELLREPDSLLEYEAFFGFENDSYVATGLGFGAEVQHPTVNAMKQKYMEMVPDDEGHYPLVVCPALNTEALIPHGFVSNGKRQSVLGAEILPADYLNPYNDITGKLEKTNNTISVHWYSKSWMSKSVVFRSMLTKPFHRFFGENCFSRWKLHQK